MSRRKSFKKSLRESFRRLRKRRSERRRRGEAPKEESQKVEEVKPTEGSVCLDMSQIPYRFSEISEVLDYRSPAFKHDAFRDLIPIGSGFISGTESQVFQRIAMHKT